MQANETEATTTTPDAQEVNALVLTSFFGWEWRQDISQKGNGGISLFCGPNDLLGHVNSPPRGSEWVSCNGKGKIHKLGINMTEDPSEDWPRMGWMPDFYHDANLLPRLLDEVAKRGLQAKNAYVYTLGKLLPDDGECGLSEWLFERAPLALKVCAALKACGVWPSEWEVPKP